MAIAELHRVTIGAKEYGVLLPDVYQNIGVAVGITKVPANDPTPPNATSPSQLVRLGVIFPIRASYTEAGKRKSRKIYAAQDKVDTALGGLRGKDLLTGETIKSACFPRRRRLG